ncbi:SAM-dependent methyltransferase [Mycobacterium sp. 1164966.3]|uniref:SAM-dependent methyltransferase n=1 Tax=Mycobacterium sp. 1164966.3 TaxID=1856861 RepID=UPI000801ED8F|nr:SAM-dependent methyltransferase [Mycobacterium sp. 1164966.3]OBA80507.1 SAM-dependent methyltransferase [Mycobacterium sp. 1164966.3]
MVRTDDDTWDATTGVGMTATFGAAARAVATNKGLLQDPFAEQLVRAAGVKYFTQLIANQLYEDDDGDNPRMTGLIDILASHARFLDQYLADAGAAGIRQAVILGSGLDTRPYRLWWPPGTTVYEVDQPDVIEFKTKVLRGLGAEVTVNRCAIGVDLRQDWLAALRRVGFDGAQPTVWIAEQLFVGYLSPDGQDAVLHEVSAASAAGSRFAADHTIWSPTQIKEGHTFIKHWREHGLDVDLSMLTYPGEYRYVPDYLMSHGWQTAEKTIVEIRAAIGRPVRRVPLPSDLAVMPRYVTAVRV